jgi:hypothetical protein
MDENYRALIQPAIDLMEKQNEKHEAWIRHVLLLASSLFGILISLHNKTGSYSHSEICFRLAICGLSLGILTYTISLYAQIEALKRLRDNYGSEALNALREGREGEPVSAPKGKLFVFCEITGSISLALAVVFLALYAVL